MNHDTEIPLRVICDSNHYSNRLNSFIEDLPYELKFGEDYSLGLSSISLPNSLLNIRDDAILNLAFFRKTTRNDGAEIITLYNNKQFSLICSFSLKIQKGVYITHRQFTDALLENYLETVYPEELPVPSIFTYAFYSNLTGLLSTDIENAVNVVKGKLEAFIKTSGNTPITFNTLKKILVTFLPDLYTAEKIKLFLLDEEKYYTFSTLMSNDSDFFWTKISSLKSILDTPKFNYWSGLQTTLNYADYADSRQKAQKAFTGKDVLKNALLFFINHTWVQVCRAQDIINSAMTLSEYMEEVISTQNLNILYEGLLNVLTVYFDDLQRILLHIQEVNRTPKYSVDHFLKNNKTPYFYYLYEEGPEKRAKIIKNELTYFLNRISYDDTRKKVVFAPIDPSYKRLTSSQKIGTNLTVLNTEGDVSVFFGHVNFRITEEHFVCKYQPRIVTDTEIYIYCKQITEQFVNNHMIQLLHVVQSADDKQYGTILQQRFAKPIFLKLNTRYLSKLEFQFRTRDGKLALFENSSDTISMVLILRPSRKGCI